MNGLHDNNILTNNSGLVNGTFSGLKDGLVPNDLFYYRNTNSNIIKNGLVLHLDASAKNSYVGSGTDWNDLSGNANNFTLINGPAYDPINGGLINYDGTNDYAELKTRNTNLEFQPTNQFSVFVWFLGQAAPASAGEIIGNFNKNLPQQGWDLWFNHQYTANTIAMQFVRDWGQTVFSAIKVKVTYNHAQFLNKWVNIGYTYDGTCPVGIDETNNAVKFYFNGLAYTAGKVVENGNFLSKNETITYNSSQKPRIASRWVSGTYSNQAALKIAVALVYNRMLSEDEVLTNFNTLRARFAM